MKYIKDKSDRDNYCTKLKTMVEAENMRADPSSWTQQDSLQISKLH